MSTKYHVQRFNGKKWKTYSVYGSHAHAEKWYTSLISAYPNYEWRVIKKKVESIVFNHYRGKGA